MTDEPADPGQRAVDEWAAEMRAKAAEALAGKHTTDRSAKMRVLNDPKGEYGGPITVEVITAVAAVAIFGRAFLESLGKRTGEAVADLVAKRVRLWRNIHPNNPSAEIALDGEHTVRFLVSKNLTDEARLALLDFDPSDPKWNGKELYWSPDDGQWRVLGFPPKPEDASLAFPPKPADATED